MFGERIKTRHPCRLLRWPALLVSRQYMLHIEANICVGEVPLVVGVVVVGVVGVVGVVVVGGVVGVVVGEVGVGHLA